MSPECRTASRLGPLPRRGMWAKGGMLASLVLVLATGVAAPTPAAAQTVTR